MPLLSKTAYCIDSVLFNKANDIQRASVSSLAYEREIRLIQAAKSRVARALENNIALARCRVCDILECEKERRAFKLRVSHARALEICVKATRARAFRSRSSTRVFLAQ